MVTLAEVCPHCGALDGYHVFPAHWTVVDALEWWERRTTPQTFTPTLTPVEGSADGSNLVQGAVDE